MVLDDRYFPDRYFPARYADCCWGVNLGETLPLLFQSFEWDVFAAVGGGHGLQVIVRK